MSRVRRFDRSLGGPANLNPSEDEYFVTGVIEEITSALSRVRVFRDRRRQHRMPPDVWVYVGRRRTSLDYVTDDDRSGLAADTGVRREDPLRTFGVGMAQKRGRPATKGRQVMKRKGGSVAAKYRDPKSGETWSGRGRMVSWLAAKVEAGEKREKYLV